MPHVPSTKNSSSTKTITLRPRSNSLHAWGNGDEEKLKQEEEESRLKVLESRRKTIRSTLKSAESLRNYRITNGKHRK